MTATITGHTHPGGPPVTGWPVWQGHTGWDAGRRYTIVDLLTADGELVSWVQVPSTSLVGVRDLSRGSDGFLWRVAEHDTCGQGERALAELAWRHRQRVTEERRASEAVAARRARIARRAADRLLAEVTQR